MPFLAVAVILISSLLHATWNLIMKRSGDKLSFSILFLWVGTVVCLVPALWSLYHGAVMPRAVYPWALGSMVLESGYWFLLGSAYGKGDMSQVYPLTRGTGALMAAVLGVALLGERSTLEFVAGVCLVVIGGYVVNLPGLSWRNAMEPLRHASDPAFRLALLTGLFTGFYSIVDKVAVYRLGAPVLLYFGLAYAGPAVVLTAYATASAKRRRTLAQQDGRTLAKAIAVGLLSPASYLLVLVAMTLAPVSRVAPFREITMVWGAILGLTVLREGHGDARLVGSVAVAAGVIVLALSK